MVLFQDTRFMQLCQFQHHISNESKTACRETVQVLRPEYLTMGL